jgi:cardiolipin synthase
LGIGIAIVGVPLTLFALVGLPHVFRSPLVRNVISTDSGHGPTVPRPGSPDFGRLLALLTGATLVGNDSVSVLANGDATFPQLWRDLRSAQRSITVQMYYAAPGAVTDTVCTILAERARAGVRVYFLYDAFGAEELGPVHIGALRAAGVRTAEFRPMRWYAPDRANHRSHVRGIVIDGRVAYTGGFGFDDKWLGAGRRPREWRETNARVVGPAAAELQAAFVAKWAETVGALVAGDWLVSDTLRADAGTIAATFLYSPPLIGSTSAERLLALSIASAQRTLYITNAYFVPHADYMQLLMDAARRGVDVRILTNSVRTDVKTTWLAGRSRYEALLAAGIRISEYLPTTVHAKTLVVDGEWSVISTMNFDNRSLAYNNEVALVVRDRAIGATMDSLFLADLRYAGEIELASFRRRSATTKLLERLASALATVL